MTTIAFYAGSFDPVTNGHLDVLRQTLVFSERVIIGIGVHATKKESMFDIETRQKLLSESVSDSRVSITTFDGLVVDAVRSSGANVLVRGVRDGTDLNYEMQMSGMNGAMSPDISTILIPSSPSVRHISATLVRQIAGMGGDISSFVPPCVMGALGSNTSS